MRAPNVAGAASSTLQPQLALRCALIFAGFVTPLPPRLMALLQVAGKGAASDLDAASKDFADTVSLLREAAGFGSPAWHEPTPELYPWVAQLERHGATIQAELRAEQDRALAAPSASGTWDGAEYEAIAPDWRFCHLWQKGQWLPSAAAQYPQTVALLQQLEQREGLRLNPMQNVACGIARQPAGSGIAPHTDGNLVGLTAHLGLQVPPEEEECWIEVGGERRNWRERQLLLMDTTHVHSTHNGGTCDRYILMLNVLRPDVSEDEVTCLRHYMTAPPLRLDGLNPGWLVVPPSRSLDAAHAAASTGGAAANSRSPPSLVCVPYSVDDEAGRVQLQPEGPWYRQRAQGGHEGVVRLEPLAGRRYRVASAEAMLLREWPAESAAACPELGPAAPGDEIAPCAAAIDADGCLEWLAVPRGSRSRWMGQTELPPQLAGGDAKSAPAVPYETLEAHLELLHEPHRFLAWLPVYDSEDTPLLERLDPEAGDP